MQMGPVIPPYTSWLAADGKSGQGISLPGQSTVFKTQLPDYRGQLSRDGFPRTGAGGTWGWGCGGWVAGVVRMGV